MSYERLVGYGNRDIRITTIPEDVDSTTPSVDGCANLVFQDDGRSISKAAPTNYQIALRLDTSGGGNTLPYLVTLNHRDPSFVDVAADNRAIYDFELSGVAGDTDFPSANPTDGFFVTDYVELWVNGSFVATGSGLVKILFQASWGDTVNVRLFTTSGGAKGNSEIRVYHTQTLPSFHIQSQTVAAKLAPTTGPVGMYNSTTNSISVPYLPWQILEGEMWRAQNYLPQHKDCCSDDWEDVV